MTEPPETSQKTTTSIVKGSLEVEGRSEDDIAQSLSRFKVLASGKKRIDACSRTARLLFLELLIVTCILALTIGAGALNHRPRSKSGHSRYQRGKENSMRAFRLADTDKDGKLTPDEVRALFDDEHKQHNDTTTTTEHRDWESADVVHGTSGDSEARKIDRKEGDTIIEDHARAT